MKVVLAELRAQYDVAQYDVAQYDVVLIDSPPLLPVTDAAAVAPATDGAILVCRFKETTRDQVAAAVEALDAVSARVLGTVFTMVPSTGPRAYAQYNAYYRTDQPIRPARPATGSANSARASGGPAARPSPSRGYQ